MADIDVRESKISGMDGFALRGFKKGEVVLKWDNSHQLSEREARQLSEEETHFLTLHKNIYFVLHPPERFVNHSCKPNNKAEDFADIATRDISKGEEITGNYSEELAPWEEVKCNCGEKDCRGVIRRE